ncbi:hypothetical protein PMAYCL1PPCAC_16497, partial [Pristionchus mayeri]
LIITIPIFTSIIFMITQVIHGKVNGVYFAASLFPPAMISLFAIRLLLSSNTKRLDRLNDAIKRR